MSSLQFPSSKVTVACSLFGSSLSQPLRKWPWWLQGWPFLWLGWWMDLSVQTQLFCPAVDPFNKVFWGCWRLGALLLLNPFNLSISLASHSSHTSLPSPDDVLFFKITFPFLTSFPLWTQIPLSKLLCTSRLVAATLPHKKEINFSSTVSNYWWQAGKAWKIFGSKKHYSNLIRVQAKLSF